MANSKVAVLSAPNPGVIDYLKRHDIKSVVFSGFNVPDEPALLVFCDGPPVTPLVWGQKGRAGFKDSFGPSFRRDIREQNMFKSFDASVPKIGIGRGALLLNAMNYGKNYLEVEGHMSNHSIMYSRTGQVVDNVASYHNQMMQPSEVFSPSFFAVGNSCTRKCMGNTLISTPTNDWLDPEIMFYPETTSMCWQPLVKDQTDPLSTFFNMTIDSLVNTGDMKGPN